MVTWSRRTDSVQLVTVYLFTHLARVRAARTTPVDGLDGAPHRRGAHHITRTIPADDTCHEARRSHEAGDRARTRRGTSISHVPLAHPFAQSLGHEVADDELIAELLLLGEPLDILNAELEIVLRPLRELFVLELASGGDALVEELVDVA